MEQGGDGNHWEILGEFEETVDHFFNATCERGAIAFKVPFPDVWTGSDQPETMIPVRLGNDEVCSQILALTRRGQETAELYSGYPVGLGGVGRRLVINAIEPWENGAEAWIHASTQGGSPLGFFDTTYFVDREIYREGDLQEFKLCAFAYNLRPAAHHVVEIGSGPLYEWDRERRLARGESAESASAPMRLVLTGMSALLPLRDGAPDEYEFRGVVASVAEVWLDDRRLWKIGMVWKKLDDEDGLVGTVYASERAVEQGYVPRVGDDVQGTLWLQGYFDDGSPLAPARP